LPKWMHRTTTPRCAFKLLFTSPSFCRSLTVTTTFAQMQMSAWCLFPRWWAFTLLGRWHWGNNDNSGPACWLESIHLLYGISSFLQIKRQRPEENSVAQQLYKKWVGGMPLSPQAADTLHTQYHKRDKSLASAVKDW